VWEDGCSSTGQSWGPDVLSSPRVVAEGMLVQGLELEQDLACELVELSVSVAGTGSVWVLVLLLPQVAMAQVVAARRLQTQDGPDLDQRVLHLVQLAVVFRQGSFGPGQLAVSLYSNKLVAAPRSSSCGPYHGSEDVLIVRLSGSHL
jgi:hypothetical protein